MKSISLSNGKAFALIDDEDYELVSKYTWFIVNRRGSIYACATPRERKGGPDDNRKSSIYMHRLIMKAQKGSMVDHADGNGLNNRRSNLRFCTASQNNANCQRKPKNKYGFRGVGSRKSRYYAKVRNGRTWKRSRSFATAQEAAVAYDLMALQIQGDFAVTNFPRENYAEVIRQI